MSAPKLYVTAGILHRSAESLQAMQRRVLRLRRIRAISAERAAQVLFDLDSLDYPDELPDQLGFILSHKDLFPDFSVIRGTVIDREPGRSMLFSHALADFIGHYRAVHGALPGEPLPVYAAGSMADHLQRRGFK
jgi:hypothetical protein